MESTTGLTEQEPERAEIKCVDGETLIGHFFHAEGESISTGLPVLICPATGIKQHFYFRFAKWLANQGHAVLVFDYRGIGLSCHGNLKECKATLADWGQKDHVAALEWMVKRTASEHVVLLGHSAGGQMIGLMPNHRRITHLIGVSASTGWFNGMKPIFRLKAQLSLRCLIPLCIKFLGYAPTSMLGLGENLPGSVARQWGQWCAAGGYATNAIRNRPDLDFHAEILIPVTVFHASDDEIATCATVGDLMRTFPNAVKKVLQVNPARIGLKSLGHMDWFRSSHQVVWPLLANAIRGKAQDAIQE